jgi:flagellar biosynthetic protein FlhB
LPFYITYAFSFGLKISAMISAKKIDAEIPAALYSAVAEVLAYVYQLAGWRQTGGAYPTPPRALQVPPELVPEAA